MEHIIGITRARNSIKEIIDSIMDNNEKYIVTRDANPEAVIISYSDYLKHKEVLKKYISLKNESDRENSKDRVKEWLSGFGVKTEVIPEEAIIKMLKDLEINT
jgi:prevent-host-death family protein